MTDFGENMEENKMKDIMVESATRLVNQTYEDVATQLKIVKKKNTF